MIGPSLDLLTKLGEIGYVGMNNLLPRNESIVKLIEEFNGNPLLPLLEEGFSKLEKAEVDTAALQSLATAILVLDSTVNEAITATFYDEQFDSNQAELHISERENNLTDGLLGLLVEIALLGFSKIPMEKLESINSVLEDLDEKKEYYRISILLHGFIDELTAYHGKDQSDEIKTRWLLMWARLMFYQHQIPSQAAIEIKKQEFTPLGITIKGRERMITLLVYGLLHQKESVEFAILQFSTFKLPDCTLAESLELIQSTNPVASKIIKEKIMKRQFLVTGQLKYGILLVDELELGDQIAVDTLENTMSIAKFRPHLAISQSLLWLEMPVLLSKSNTDKLKSRLDEIKKLSDINASQILDSIPEDTLYIGLLTWNNGFQVNYIGKVIAEGIEVVALPDITNLKTSDRIDQLRTKASKLLREKS